MDDYGQLIVKVKNDLQTMDILYKKDNLSNIDKLTLRYKNGYEFFLDNYEFLLIKSFSNNKLILKQIYIKWHEKKIAPLFRIYQQDGCLYFLDDYIIECLKKGGLYFLAKENEELFKKEHLQLVKEFLSGYYYDFNNDLLIDDILNHPMYNYLIRAILEHQLSIPNNTLKRQKKND